MCGSLFIPVDEAHDNLCKRCLLREYLALRARLDAEMRLIVDAGCHPDCQHMQHCIRCGPICKTVRDKLMVENRKEE